MLCYTYNKLVPDAQYGVNLMQLAVFLGRCKALQLRVEMMPFSSLPFEVYSL